VRLALLALAASLIAGCVEPPIPDPFLATRPPANPPTPTIPPAPVLPTIPAKPTAEVFPTATPGQVMIFAASDIGEVLQEMSTDFMIANREVGSVGFTFDNSTKLSSQLQRGAAADVFISGDELEMNLARRANVLNGDPRPLVITRLVVVVAKNNPKQIAEARDLAREGVRIAAPGPADRISRGLPAFVAKAATVDPDLKARVERNIQLRGGTFESLVPKLHDGMVDAAVVYTSDLTSSQRSSLQVVAVPAELDQPETYFISVVKGANPDGAQAFVAYLQTPPALKIFAEWGFFPHTP
jgi:molybdate transport system substrate-binding protein